MNVCNQILIKFWSTSAKFLKTFGPLARKILYHFLSLEYYKMALQRLREVKNRGILRGHITFFESLF